MHVWHHKPHVCAYGDTPMMVIFSWIYVKPLFFLRIIILVRVLRP